jgi:hypothetical protein
VNPDQKSSPAEGHRMPSFTPPTFKKLRFNQRSNATIDAIVINENVVLVTHKHHLQEEKSNLIFLLDIFWSFKIKFRSSVNLIKFLKKHHTDGGALLSNIIMYNGD